MYRQLQFVLMIPLQQWLQFRQNPQIIFLSFCRNLVQDADDTSIPEDVKEKILHFIKAGLTVAEMRDKSYLFIGYSSMGIAGSMIDPDFFQNYLGIRTEFVESLEILRRIDEKIYDEEIIIVHYNKCVTLVIKKRNHEIKTDLFIAIKYYV